jgi:hypothetical protein
MREPEVNAIMPMIIAAWVTDLVLILKANFMPPSNSNISEKEEVLEEEGREGAHTKGRNPGTVPMAEVTATAPPWFLVRAQKPTGEGVSVSLLTTALPLY